MNPTRAIAIFAALAALVPGCGADAPTSPPERESSARIEAKPATVKIAQPLDVVITVEHPTGTEVLFPPAPARLGGMDVTRAGEVRSREIEPGWRLTTRTFRARSFDVGAYSLGPVEVKLSGKGGEPVALATPVARVEVVSALAGGKSSLEDMRDIRGPFELAPEPPRFSRALAILSALAAAVVGGVFAMRHLGRRDGVELAEAKPVERAHEIALRELREARESGMLERGEVDGFVDRVSDTLRRYLEARFELPAPERTTEEFLDEIARAPVLDRDRKRFLADYLARCDLVKFAAADPGRRELDGLHSDSVRFVNETASSGGAGRG